LNTQHSTLATQHCVCVCVSRVLNALHTLESTVYAPISIFYINSCHTFHTLPRSLLSLLLLLLSLLLLLLPPKQFARQQHKGLHSVFPSTRSSFIYILYYIYLCVSFIFINFSLGFLQQRRECVCEREREREREQLSQSQSQSHIHRFISVVPHK